MKRSSGYIRSSTRLYGIPKLFRWLVDLYPLIVESVSKGLTEKSSSNMQVDNFYLDMNGIIHSCTHSNNDKLIVNDEKEMFLKIFAYTDRLYKLVKPKRMMFLAIDGVAPRAKMNQQRSRRFRASKEREALIAEYVAKEGKLPELESFDSNCITPGTEFMFRLGIAFNKWIEYKMKTDPFYLTNGADIVFSGPDVPGEGEHKVMDMIRLEQKSTLNYKTGQWRYCMYGLDADLIMLSLVTHEPLFILLREKMSTRKSKKDTMSFTQEDFELLEISVLRKMLYLQFKNLGQSSINTDPKGRSGRELLQAVESEFTENISPKNDFKVDKADEKVIESVIHGKIVKMDAERAIDDFVFMCFFVGNDFLPCVPHLDIADGSLNLMMGVYKDMFTELGGYLTNKNRIHLPRLELFMQEMSRREPLYFQQRAVDEKDEGYAKDDYKDYYYQVKFGLEPGDLVGRRRIVEAYLRGLAWVLTYYHEGCGSWTWYYPYLYGPLASDLVNLAELDITFEQGQPFTPLLQLLSVLPPQSGPLLPKPYEDLMTNPLSPIVNFYPKIFAVDANGKKNSWESIVQIPFINEKLLIDSVNTIDHATELSESEKQRNILGSEKRYQPNINDKKKVLDGNQDQRAEQSWGNALQDDRGGRSRYQQGGRNSYTRDSRSVSDRKYK